MGFASKTAHEVPPSLPHRWGELAAPRPISLQVCVDHVVAWSTRAFPITVCHFCLAGFCSEAKESHVQHLRMYVMVSVLFLTPQ